MKSEGLGIFRSGEFFNSRKANFLGEIEMTNAIVSQLFSSLENIGRQHPEYWALFEDTDVDSASSDLLNLINTAPAEQIRYFLLGKLTTRLQIAAITGRS